MQTSDISRAIAAARSSASVLNLKVDDAIVLQNSNRLTVRLLPCNVLARVALGARKADALLEVEVARQLTKTDSPVAELDPRVEPKVYVHDDFAITLWTYYDPASPSEIEPIEYAQALERLHTGMRQVDMQTPHFLDRVARARQLVDNRAHTPDLPDADRELLSNSLRNLTRSIVDRACAEQMLHGEPHPGNLLRTKNGLMFIDLETCCRGPVEFDIAHAPNEVSVYYTDYDHDLLQECRILMLAMIVAWRWDRDDQLPNGRRLGLEWLSQMRAILGE